MIYTPPCWRSNTLQSTPDSISLAHAQSCVSATLASGSFDPTQNCHPCSPELSVLTRNWSDIFGIFRRYSTEPVNHWSLKGGDQEGVWGEVLSDFYSWFSFTLFRCGQLRNLVESEATTVSWSPYTGPGVSGGTHQTLAVSIMVAFEWKHSKGSDKSSGRGDSIPSVLFVPLIGFSAHGASLVQACSQDYCAPTEPEPPCFF